jgi:hypothetical protein
MADDLSKRGGSDRRRIHVTPSLYAELMRLKAADEQIETAKSALDRQQHVIRAFQRIGDVISVAEARKIYRFTERALARHVRHRHEIFAGIRDLIAGQRRNADAEAAPRARSAQPALRRAA